jgi:hypothetical protein
MAEEFVRQNFPNPIIDLFWGMENMSSFPILEWDEEWNDLRDMERFCPTEPRWITNEKIIAPFMMGVAVDHNNLARLFVLIRTQIFMTSFRFLCCTGTSRHGTIVAGQTIVPMIVYMIYVYMMSISTTLILVMTMQRPSFKMNKSYKPRKTLL